MISVVVPCYNCEKTIRRTIESIVGQTSDNWELILIDDGSTDNTAAICDKFSEQNDRIKVFHQSNKGLMRAWKTGVEMSSGEYVAFCDADDFFDSDFILYSENVLRKDVDLFAFGIEMDYENGDSVISNNYISGYFDKEEIDKKIIPVLFPDPYAGRWLILQTRVTKVYKRDLLDRIMPFLPDHISQGEDNLTTFAAVMSAGSIISVNDYSPYHYMRNNDSMIGKYDDSWFNKLMLLNKELIKLGLHYKYPYIDRIEIDFVYNTIVYLKKEITRSGKSFKDTLDMMKKVRDDEAFTKAASSIQKMEFPLKFRLFARLFLGRHHIILYFMTKTLDKFGMGKP